MEEATLSERLPTVTEYIDPSDKNGLGQDRRRDCQPDDSIGSLHRWPAPTGSARGRPA
jgi:hypothetical protein